MHLIVCCLSVMGDEQLAKDFLRVTRPLREKLYNREATSRNRPSLMQITMELEAYSPPTTSTSTAATPPLTPSLPEWDLEATFDAEALEVFAPQQETDNEDEILPLPTTTRSSPSLSYHSVDSPPPRINLPITLDSDTSFIPGDLSLLSALGQLQHNWPSSSSQLGNAGIGDRLVEAQGGLLSRHKVPSSSLFSNEGLLDSSVVNKPLHSPGHTPSIRLGRTPSKPAGWSVFGELDDQARSQKPRRGSCPPRPYLPLKAVPDEFFITPPKPARQFSEVGMQTDQHKHETPAGELLDLLSDNKELEVSALESSLREFHL